MSASRLYVPTLIALENTFRDQDVQFVGVFSNSSEDLLEMATFAHDYEIPFPVVKDPFNHLADHLKVARVPEVVLLDRELNVLYKGQINDQYRAGGRLPEVKHHYLRDAIDEFLAGKPVSTPSTLASGCHIDRYREPRYETPVTFNKHVAPIFQKKCQTCHREGQIGPFPLVTFDEVRSHALMIAEVVEDRRMPPWLGRPTRRSSASYRTISVSRKTRSIPSWPGVAPAASRAIRPTCRRQPNGPRLGRFRIPMRLWKWRSRLVSRPTA